MSNPKVYVSRVVNPSVLTRLSEVCEVRAWQGPGKCSADVLEMEIADVSAVLGTDRWTAELMDKAPRVRIIANTSVGYDNVDLGAATERGIIVTNTAGSLTDTVADLTFALVLAAARRVCEMDSWVKAGQWRAFGTAPMGLDVHHKTLGLVGLGRIGAAVADRARGFHMKVLYYDAYRREDLEKEFGYRFADLDSLCSESDFISLHTDLNAKTRGMFSEAQLAKMKPTAFLINTSRGEVVDEAALIKVLQAKRIAGAGLDVFEKDPIDPDSPLLKMENVVTLPHEGSATNATRQAMVDLAADNILAVLQGKPPLTPVNREVLSRPKR